MFFFFTEKNLVTGNVSGTKMLRLKLALPTLPNLTPILCHPKHTNAFGRHRIHDTGPKHRTI